MSDIYVGGFGAVSPAGWSVDALRDVIAKNEPLRGTAVQRPVEGPAATVLRVPPPSPRPAFLNHSRLRRTSPISQFAVAAVVEALHNAPHPSSATAVISCVFSGCVTYSRRFYDETLKEPATASPLLFPETVFNAPASHISAYLGSSAINYTLVGDLGTFLVGVALGARWLLEGKAEQCVVVGTEEIDWLTVDAMRLFDRSKILSEGAGAILLTRSSAGAKAKLNAVSSEFHYSAGGKAAALASMRHELEQDGGGCALISDSTSAGRGISRQEVDLWKSCSTPRISPRTILGEGLMAASAWQSVLAADAIATAGAGSALVSIAGFHQHAIGARFTSVHRD